MHVTDPRSLIFISHARPEDDDLTRWLCGRLTALGYRVWADLEQLLGGDPFWNDIQRAIRHEAARLVVIVTHASCTRQGVLNEIAEASDVARALADPRFIVPLRGDNIPWSDFPIQIKQLNGIDFSSEWTTGFNTLIKTLETSAVPRSTGDPAVARLAELLVRGRQTIKKAPDYAVLNRLSIHGLPHSINYFHTSLSAADLSRIQPGLAVPCTAHDRLLISFCDLASMRAVVPSDVEVEERHTLPLSSFLIGHVERGPRVTRRQAHSYLSSILRDAFSQHLRGAGLVQFDRRWFVPRGWRDDNQGRYLRAGGKEHYRVLVGKAKELTWHFAISFKVFASDPRRVQVVPHVLFSADGITPLADQKQLRRRHCKLWWNDKWRDLLMALCGEAFGQTGHHAAIGLGGSARMLLDASPLRIELPVYYSADLAYLPDSEDDVPDWEDADDRNSAGETSE